MNVASLLKVAEVAALPPANGDNAGSLVVSGGQLFFSNGSTWINLTSITTFQFPIGSVLITTNNNNPSLWLGYGVWEQFAQGRCLVGVDTSQTEFNTPLKTGGAKTHTLTLSEIPPHNHSFSRSQTNAQVGSGVSGVWYGTSGSAVTTSYVGGGLPHNNLQPYITVYFWQRTA